MGSRSESERIFGETCAGSSLAARDLKGFHVTRIIRALTSYMLQKHPKTVNGHEVDKLKYCFLLLPKELYSQEQDHKSH